MKKNILAIAFSFITLFLIFVVPARAQMGMMGDYYNDDASPSSQTEQQNQQKLNILVNALLKAQNVSSVNQLDCQKIGNDQLAKLGDSWMDVMIPNESQHQAMDNRMGGEGSQSLTNAHIGMAKNYLGCSTGNTNDSWMPMMFGAYHNDENNTSARGGGFPMMGWGYGYGNGVNGTFWGFGVLALLFWLVVFIDFILAGIWLWQQIRAPKKK
jgi:hypothetical protein